MVTFILPSQHAKCDMMQLKENKGFSFVKFKSKAKQNTLKIQHERMFLLPQHFTIFTFSKVGNCEYYDMWINLSLWRLVI